MTNFLSVNVIHFDVFFDKVICAQGLIDAIRVYDVQSFHHFFEEALILLLQKKNDLKTLA